MTGLEVRSRVLIVVALILVSGSILVFRRRQNQASGTGGRISRPKSVWLAIAVFDWFLLAPILGFDPNVPGPLRAIFLTFSGLMWARGLAELFLLYVTKSWRPPYGIAHDALCMAALAGLTLWYRAEWAGLRGPLEHWLLAFVVVNFLSLIVEIYYAFAFFGLVHGATTGEAGTWFATDEEERFRRLNRITTLFNSLHLLFLAPLLAFLLGVVA